MMRMKRTTKHRSVSQENTCTNRRGTAQCRSIVKIYYDDKRGVWDAWTATHRDSAFYELDRFPGEGGSLKELESGRWATLRASRCSTSSATLGSISSHGR